jgi:hypothetical protein
MHAIVEGHEILSAKMLPTMIDSINTCLSFCYQDNPIDQWQKVVSLTINGTTHGMAVIMHSFFLFLSVLDLKIFSFFDFYRYHMFLQKVSRELKMKSN